MTEYLYNDYYDGPDRLRVGISPDYDAENPRDRHDNICVIEVWDRVEASPDVDVASEAIRRVIWSFTGPGNMLAMNFKGTRKSYVRLDPHWATTIARWLVAFHGAVVAKPLMRDDGGALHIANEGDAEMVGVAWVEGKLEDDIELINPHLEIDYELAQYNTWARGDVWAFEVQELLVCPCGGACPDCAGDYWQDIPKYGEVGVYYREVAKSWAMESLAAAYSERAMEASE